MIAIAMIRARLRRHGDAADAETGGEAEFVEIDTSGLSGVFAAPRWLRDAGFSAWLLVGVALLVAGTIALLSLTVLGVGMVVVVVGGIVGQSSDIAGHLSDARTRSPAGSRISAWTRARPSTQPMMRARQAALHSRPC